MKPLLSLWKGPLTVTAESRRERMRAILAEVADKHGVTPEAIQGRSCAREVSNARQEAMHRLYDLGWLSTPHIGRFLNRDHSTVVYGLKAHEARIAASREAQAA